MGILAQEDHQATGTNIQTYTPSKLLCKDSGTSNGLTISTPKQKGVDEHGNSSSFPRQNLFTASLMFLLESAKTTVSM